MRTYLDCIPCFFKQALFAARAAVDDERRIKEVLDRVGMLVSEMPLDGSPPRIAREVYRAVKDVTGVEDPFAEIKAESIHKALLLYPALEQKVSGSADPLEAATRMAIAGNIIDFGANPDFHLQHEVEEALFKKPAIDDFQSFIEILGSARNVLYIGDNAGETVFDRLLIETMEEPVVYAARGTAVINDATVDDAVNSGLDRVAHIISSGSDAPGVILEGCSKEFLEHFNRADLIISKGQGNYETLSESPRPIVFLLKAKCPIIARDLGVQEGDTVIRLNRPGGGGS